jgi:hypothetical protein
MQICNKQYMQQISRHHKKHGSVEMTIFSMHGVSGTAMALTPLILI